MPVGKEGLKPHELDVLRESGDGSVRAEPHNSLLPDSVEAIHLTLKESFESSCSSHGDKYTKGCCFCEKSRKLIVSAFVEMHKIGL